VIANPSWPEDIQVMIWDFRGAMSKQPAILPGVKEGYVSI